MKKFGLKWNNLVSVRLNYFIFMGYLKTGAEVGVWANPWTPSWSATDSKNGMRQFFWYLKTYVLIYDG